MAVARNDLGRDRFRDQSHLFRDMGLNGGVDMGEEFFKACFAIEE